MPMKRFGSVEEYLGDNQHFPDEVAKLREVLLKTTLTETVKWSLPCYTYEGTNVVGLGAFKSYFGLWFFDGAKMPDPASVLVNAQTGKTKALRQWRMNSAADIKPRIIKQYVKEAIAVVQRGETLKPAKASRSVVVPPELASALDGDAQLRRKFDALTPGKRKDYCGYISEAKRADTKVRRIEKIVPMILEGLGLHDRYRSDS